MKFDYKARTREGKIETGTIEASNEQAAVLLLQKYDIFVTLLREQVPAVSVFQKINLEAKISKKELAVFSRQLAVMLDSRVPVILSLSSLAAQENKRYVKKAISGIAALVEEGVLLSEAMGRFPGIFDNFYVNLIKSAELSGEISKTLYYISDHLERDADIAAKLRQALVYPAFTLAMLFVVVNIIVIFLLPKVQELILQSAVKPSGFTIITLDFYQFLGNFWWVILLALLALAVCAVWYVKTKPGKKIYDILSLKIPVLGDILRKVFLVRFCGNISTLITAGISISQALKITAATVDNSAYQEIIMEIEKRVLEGEKISSVLVSRQDYFPSFVIQMIKVGEETGKLDKTLMEVVDFYQKDIKESIDLFLTLLEPILIIFLGLIVGLLAVSVFAPLYATLGNI